MRPEAPAKAQDSSDDGLSPRGPDPLAFCSDPYRVVYIYDPIAQATPSFIGNPLYTNDPDYDESAIIARIRQRPLG
jgi:hypothetical protein